MRQTDPFNKVKSVAILFCMIFTFALAAMVWYFYMTAHRFELESQDFRMRIQNAQSAMENFDRVMGQYQEDIASFEKFLFTEKDIPLFLENLSASSKKFDVSVINIEAMAVTTVDPSSDTPSKSRRTLDKKQQEEEEDPLVLVATPFRIELNGDFYNILEFMLSLEQSRQLLTVSDVQIAIMRHPTLRSTFRLDLYSLTGPLAQFKKGTDQ